MGKTFSNGGKLVFHGELSSTNLKASGWRLFNASRVSATKLAVRVPAVHTIGTRSLVVGDFDCLLRIDH